MGKRNNDTETAWVTTLSDEEFIVKWQNARSVAHFAVLCEYMLPLTKRQRNAISNRRTRLRKLGIELQNFVIRKPPKNLEELKLLAQRLADVEREATELSVEKQEKYLHVAKSFVTNDCTCDNKWETVCIRHPFTSECTCNGYVGTSCKVHLRTEEKSLTCQ